MSNFNEALDVLLSWEGGYSQNPRDPGGETYCGISRKHWPNWSGWVIIDDIKAMGHQLKWNEKSDRLTGQVASFYQQNFWNSYYEQINDQDVCNKLFQHNVNMGERAIRLLQEVLFVDYSSIDGSLGPNTVSHINSTPSNDLLANYASNVEQYYQELIRKHPQLHTFETEWMLRAKTIGKRPN